ncbi:MAG: hypothetical protein OXG35_34310 [Acidobacteria bacterium]|nr:hypothetical protein [Acidobacteriota bacterium]
MAKTKSFAVLLTDTDPDARAKCRSRLRTAFPDAHELNDSAFLVSGALLTNQVAEKVGIKGDDRWCAGVVFKISRYYSGYTDGDTWEWLKRTEED